MLLAADILSRSRLSKDYESDIIFTALSGEAFDLMASRKLLYDLQHKQKDSRAAANLEGIELSSLDAIVEVGMLGFDEGAYNGTGGTGGDLFVHSTTTPSAAATALIQAGNATSGSLSVRPPLQLQCVWCRASGSCWLRICSSRRIGHWHEA